ncbi:MAG: hypothetical protein PHW63_09425, partial [Alphaproteobacteria bacterium]|nr:hypothetical protein [Alphaproteobacteria bacterium]
KTIPYAAIANMEGYHLKQNHADEDHKRPQRKVHIFLQEIRQSRRGQEAADQNKGVPFSIGSNETIHSEKGASWL